MQIRKVVIKDFLSIKEATIEFPDSGLILVDGWNNDTSRSNGAGKTAIFNAISFCLFEKIPRKISPSEVIRRGQSKAYVEVHLLSGEDSWVVKRYRPRAVEFHKNGELLNITQEEFESHVRLSYDQYILSAYAPQSSVSSYPRFVLASDSDKKSFILKLMNIDKFSEVKKHVDDKIKDVEAKKTSMLSAINNYISQVETYKRLIKDENLLSSKLEEINKDIAELSSQLETMSSIEPPDVSKLDSMEAECRASLNEIIKQKGVMMSLMENIEALNNEKQEIMKSKDDVCKYCGSKIDNSSRKEHNSAYIQSIDNKIDVLKNKLVSIKEQISDEKKISELLSKITEAKNSKLLDYRASLSKRDSMQKLLQNKREQANMIIKDIENNNSLINKINFLSKTIREDSAVVDSLQEKIDLLKTISHFYSPTGAQAYVLDSVIESFNEKIEKYTELIHPSLTYRLSSFKETSKGDTVAKISEQLIKNGQEIPLGSLSGGEFRGLSLCIDLALIDVLESSFGLKINPIILDEPFDGLDYSGREIVLSMLRDMSRDRAIVVVDHASESKSSFSNIISVVLSNGVSAVEQN